MTLFRRLFGVMLVSGGALAALAACNPVMTQGNMGPPEKLTFYDKPFNGFTEDEARSARWLAFDLMMNTDRTLADPVQTLQDFSQLEYTANALKATYIHMRPTQLQNLLEARDQIRGVMGLPATANASDAIMAYANRGRSLSDADRRLLDERKGSLRGPMIVAGRALHSYVESLDRSFRRDSEPPQRN